MRIIHLSATRSRVRSEPCSSRGAAGPRWTGTRPWASGNARLPKEAARARASTPADVLGGCKVVRGSTFRKESRKLFVSFLARRRRAPQRRSGGEIIGRGHTIGLSALTRAAPHSGITAVPCTSGEVLPGRTVCRTRRPPRYDAQERFFGSVVAYGVAPFSRAHRLTYAKKISHHLFRIIPVSSTETENRSRRSPGHHHDQRHTRENNRVKHT